MPAALPIQDFIRQAAKKHGVPEALALAIAEKESSFNPTAIGPEIANMPGVRAIGTFQLLPSTAKSLGVDPEDPAQNIEGGVKYLRQLLDEHDGDLNAVLASYGGFKTADPTPYITGIQAGIQRFSQPAGDSTSTAAAPSARTIPAKAVITGRPSGTASGPKPAPGAVPGLGEAVSYGMAGAGRFMSELGRAAIVEPIKGVATLASTAYSQGPLEAAKQLGRGIVEPSRRELELATKARREDADPLAWAAHMASAIPIYGPIAKQAGEQIAEGDIAGGLGRAVGGLIPIRGVRRTGGSVVSKAIAGKVGASAAASMTKLLRAAGDGSPAAERALQKVVPLALDQSILRATKGRMVEAARTAKQATGKAVGETLAGPAGDVIVNTAPVIEGLDALEQQVTNYVPVSAGGKPVGVAGARSATDLRAVAYNKRLVNQIGKLKDIIQSHGPTVYTRQLVNLRRDWDDFVYKSKSWLNRDQMKTQYEARAKSAATDAIREIIDQDPRLIDLAQVDKAHHLHSQLYSFIADEAFGKGHGMTPYYPGFGVNAAITRRMFSAATKSPTWRLLPISAKMKLSRRMAANNENGVRLFLREVLGGGAAAVGRGDDDLFTSDDALIAQAGR